MRGLNRCSLAVAAPLVLAAGCRAPVAPRPARVGTRGVPREDLRGEHVEVDAAERDGRPGKYRDQTSSDMPTASKSWAPT